MDLKFVCFVIRKYILQTRKLTGKPSYFFWAFAHVAGDFRIQNSATKGVRFGSVCVGKAIGKLRKVSHPR